MSLISGNMHIIIIIIIIVPCNIICCRVLMAHHAELSLGTLQSIVLLRHNPRYFVSGKLEINLFSYRNLQSVSRGFFFKWIKTIF
jgi:hypothetical protein